MKDESLPPHTESMDQLDPRNPEVMATAIDITSAEDIIALHRYLIEEDEKNSKEKKVRPLTGHEEYLTALKDSLYGALDRLPQRNLGQARSIFSQLAVSPVAVDRAIAGILMYELAEVDREFAMSYLERLVRDHDKSVRDLAYTPLSETGFDDKEVSEEQGEAVTSWGLTAQDAWRLRDLRLEAEAGRNLHDPRREALARLIDNLNKSHS